MYTCSCKNVKLKRKKIVGGEVGRINNEGRLVVEETKKDGQEREGKKERRERERKERSINED